MTPTQTQSPTEGEVEAARARLPELAERITETREHLDWLYEQRRQEFVTLLAGGERQAAVARLAHVSPDAVALAVKPRA